MTTTQRHLLLIFLIGAGLFFLGNAAIMITDPVESNYTLTAKEMLFSGDFISPRIYGNFWYDKPVFFYWELIAAFQAFGINEFAARFFPAVFGIIGLFMTYFFTRRIYDAKTAVLASLILGTSFEYWLISKTVITDLTLFVFFNAVLVFFYLAYTGKNKNWYYLCYLASGLAVLTKGPIGILLPGFIVTVFICLRRDFAEVCRMKPLGFVLFAIVAGSWYYPMYQLHGSAFIDTFLGVHNVLRATVSEHPQWDVWYYYTMIFFVGFFPWCFSLPMVLRKYWKKRQWPVLDQTTLFLLIWALAVNVFYQCMATKYTTYTLPGLLPIAILTARLLYSKERLVRRLVIGSVIFYAALTFLVAIPVCRDRGYSGWDTAALLRQQVQPGDLVVSYGDYRTSIVFYSGQIVYNLVPRREIAQDQPKAMSWKSKNVMPYYPLEALPEDQNVYLVLNERKYNEFPRDFQTDEWTELGVFANNRVYMRPAKMK
jgi:4-amino-4-deoxy-L-arabinose transferase-like glycosyltransferase